MEALLHVDGLTVELAPPAGRAAPVRVVDGVTFALFPGRLHALVGESGSGKSMTAYALLRLLPPGARVVGGTARLGAVDLLALADAELAALRGRHLAMMVQEPLAALNPVARVGAQIGEALVVHQALAPAAARERAVALLREVGIADPERRVDAYPHQLSGGMRQRVLLAAALACEPKVLVADEPTTALDATLRGVVLELLREVATRRRLGALIITHDLAAVREVCDELSVLYAGRVVERGPAAEVLAQPLHPYTVGLLRSQPTAALRGQALPAMAGNVPSPAERIAGCRFHPRCPKAAARCREEAPALPAEPRGAACFFPG